MKIFKEIGPLRQFLQSLRNTEQTIGFVPTMGALHQGHLNLIATAKSENQVVVCSIYVNPAQFNNPADLGKYPRTLERDTQLLIEAGCHILFCPDSNEMYPEPATIKFDFGMLDKILEGAFRPGHFSGVALVVSKFFNIVNPDRAYFGQKDFQQFKIISRLVDELQFNLRLVCVPTMREQNGLAMSSRNVRLNAAERKKAVVLVESLTYAKNELRKNTDLETIRREVEKMCTSLDVKLEYLELATEKNLTLQPDVNNAGRNILMIAAYVGEVRLIDNMFVEDQNS